MGIKNTTEEVENLRKQNALDDRIEMLRPEAAIFCLKALMLAGHVSENVMSKALDLSDVVKP